MSNNLVCHCFTVARLCQWCVHERFYVQSEHNNLIICPHFEPFTLRKCRCTSLSIGLSELMYGFCLLMSLCTWFACCLFFFCLISLYKFCSAGKVHIAEYVAMYFLSPIPVYCMRWSKRYDGGLFCMIFLFTFCLKRDHSSSFWDVQYHFASHACLLVAFLLLAWPTECSTMFVCGHGSCCCRTLLHFAFLLR